MNTNNLKIFAKKARQILMQSISRRLAYWGFDESGNVVEEVHAIKDGYIFREQPFDDKDVPKKWQNLHSAIKRHSVKDVIEEAAYTWFNRLLVIKILEKNNYITPKLECLSSDLNDPKILTDARKNKIECIKSNDKEKLNRYLQESDDENAFGLLLSNYCHGHPLLNRVFGYIDDYTELLLPNNLLANDGIISLINSNEFITDNDYKQVELIGWLYEFYISDKKNDVFEGFKKTKKARAEDIPAATQIFTPKWIVKYLVENTVGRIWLDKHPESPIRETMKYLVEPKNEEPGEPIIDNVTELKVLDPAVGSGHFLVVAFDLLIQAYKEEGYTNRYAVESIISHNLYGLDICKRAVGLANFAILLKGASYYPDILSKDVAPRIVAMPEQSDFNPQQITDFLGENGRHYASELKTVLEEMQMAQNIGSALVIDLTDGARDFIAKRLNEFTEKQKLGELDLLEIGLLNSLKPFLHPILMLTDAYPSVVANPPYMGSKKMNADLSYYLKSHYPNSKSDLFAVFIEMMSGKLQKSGFLGSITMESWMFLSSYEKLRYHLLDNCTIKSLSHFGWHIIGIAFGTVAFVVKNTIANENNKGVYSHLTIYDINDETASPKQFPKKDNGRFAIISQTNFSKLPGSPIAYWVSERVIEVFQSSTIGDYTTLFQGIITGNNTKFVRFWQELSIHKVTLNASEVDDVDCQNSYWVPYNKGGESRKWYGNQELVVNFKNKGKDFTRGKHQFYDYFFKPCFSWTYISSNLLATRYFPSGFIWDVAGSSAFPYDQENMFYFLALIASKNGKMLLDIINPTFNYQVENIAVVPVIFPNKDEKRYLNNIVKKNIQISKTDWDCRETSWDFLASPLIEDLRLNNEDLGSMRESYDVWEERVTANFFQLHENEEELNRIFIDIYGLQDELTPDVALKDITLLQDEIDRNELKARNDELLTNKTGLPIKKDVVIKQLLSYAVGCFMGRYRLDKPGLNIAHTNPTEEELSAYSTNIHYFEIDDDAIIPIMGSESPFSDDIVFRVKKYIQMVWGEDPLTENLNYINECLGEDLEKYLTNKFWNDHKKTYKKKPIYWLFGSPDKSFQVLVYMHRMNRFTVQKIRNNYLLKYLNYLNDQIGYLEADEASLSKNDAKRLDTLRIAQIECREYDKIVKDYADRQIEFDLDDGVSVNHAKFEGIVAKI